MSSVFPITDDPRYRRYTASAGQTVFPIPFPFLQNEDLGIYLQTSSSEYTLFPPETYVLSGAENPAGGTLTLNVPRSAGDVILILGEAVLDRLSSIVRDGRFSSSLIDSELDRIRIIELEFRRDNNRSLKVDYGAGGLTIAADLADGDTLMKQGDWLVKGPNAEHITSAEGYAEEAKSASETALDVLDQILILAPNAFPATRLELKALPTSTITSAYLKEPGREGQFIWKTGDFSARIAADPQGAVYLKADAVAGTAGAWVRAVFTPLDPRWFGAVGDGVINDAAAIQAMLNFAGQNNLAVELPAGKFACGTTGLTASGVPRICGRGRQATKFIWDAGFTGFGLDITISLDGAYSQQVELAGFSLETKAAATGGAIRVVGTSSGAGSVNMDRSTNRLTVRDIFITGKTFPLTDGWSTGLTLRNITNALIDGFSFRGKVSSAGEPNYDSNDAIAYQGDGITPHHVALTVVNSFITYAKRGLNAYDFEGLLVDNCQIIGVDKGILFAAATDYPHASVCNSHINAATTCIEITNIKEFVIIGNCLYNELGAAAGKHIDVVGISSFGTISGNIFENLKTAIHSNSVVLRNTVHHCLITSNVWKRTNPVNGSTTSGICLWMMPSTTWNKAPASVNLYDASGTYLLNEGTNNSG